MTIQTFSFGSTSARRSSGIVPNDAEHTTVDAFLKSGKIESTTQAVEYLLSRNWTVSAICAKLTYKSDSKTLKDGKPVRLAGAQLRPQHVNHIRDRYLAKKASPAT